MNLEFSFREKLLLVIAGFLFVFFLYWQFILSPLIASIDNNRAEIRNLKNEIAHNQAITSALAKLGPQKAVKYFQREEQLSRIIRFIHERFNAYKIQMASLGQSNMGDELVIDVEFQAAYPALQKFLVDLVNLDMLLMIDKVNVNQAGSKLAVGLVLRSGYLK
jgi:type II secretory pathway component PulM